MLFFSFKARAKWLPFGRQQFKHIFFSKILLYLISNHADLKFLRVQVTTLALIEAIVCCCQAASHYLNQCWPKSLTPYGLTWPQWINSLWPDISIISGKDGISLKFISKGWSSSASALINSLAPGRLWCHFKTAIFNFLYWLVPSDLLMTMHPDECHGTSQMISHHWFR